MTGRPTLHGDSPVAARPWIRRPAPWLALGSVAVVIVAAAFAFHAAVTPNTAPSCAWSDAAISGGTHSQRGVVRCYLRALATRSHGGMRAVTDELEPPPINDTAFVFSTAAAAGVTRVSFRANDSDSADMEVDFVFANARKDVQELHIADPTSSTDWWFVDVDSHSSRSYTN